MEMKSFDLNTLKFDESGFIPVILQDKITGKILKHIFLNRETLASVIKNENLNYEKYEAMNLTVTDFYCDSNKSSIIICLAGKSAESLPTEYSSILNNEILQDKKETILEILYDVILERKKTKPENSYVSKKMGEGIDRILKKIGEEAGEVIIASKNGVKEEIGWEMADLIFHMWLVLGYYGFSPDIIYEKLYERHFEKSKKSVQ